VAVYDAWVGWTYGQNGGEGQVLVAEVAWGWQGWRNWSLFGSGSYSLAVFDEDLQTSASTTLPVKGLQFPDTPRWMGTMGALWQSVNVKAGPVLRYMGGRYDDSVHTNRFGGYTVLDVSAQRAWRIGLLQWEAKVSVLNVADKRYIALIDVGELQSSGNIGYYPGAPRTVLASLTMRY
jgi:iron complex outermembrane receptor protein